MQPDRAPFCPPCMTGWGCPGPSGAHPDCQCPCQDVTAADLAGFDPAAPIGTSLTSAAAGEQVAVQLNANGVAWLEAGAPL